MAGSEASDRAQGAAELVAAVANFGRFVRGLSEPDLAEKRWGTREVLAHLVFWGESYVAQVEAICQGRKPQPPRGRFDDLNVQAISASRAEAVATLLRRLEGAAAWLGEIAISPEAGAIRFPLKHGSPERPLAWYLFAEAGHIRAHLNALEKQARWEPAAESAKLRQAVEDFVSAIRRLPAESIRDQPWGPKEVLAHLLFWHERHVAHIEALLSDRPFGGPHGRQEELNELAVAASRGLPVEELLWRLRAADERLRRYGETLDPQEMVLEVHWGRGVWHMPLDAVLGRVTRHIREHRLELETAVGAVEGDGAHGHVYS